jgi:hypothetical protein
MLVDSRNTSTERSYYAGQELEGAEAEYQVALGHAEALPEPAPEPEPKPKSEPKPESAPAKASKASNK